MTLTTQTTYTLTCDGTLATACDASHPDQPHTCPASLTATDLLAVIKTALVARWEVAAPGGDPVHLTAHCPAHHGQAVPADPDCTAPGFSGEGRCIEPAGPDGLCATHHLRARSAGYQAP